MRQLNIHFNRLRAASPVEGLNWENIISRHKEMYQLIVNKQAEQAMNVMERHLRLVVVEQDILREKYPHYFI